MDQKSINGFTLIEIIVVLIIVGILAAIALPNLFSNVQKSKAAEALAGISSIKSSVESCVQGHSATIVTSCTVANLDLITTTGNYTYAIVGLAQQAVGQVVYTLTAKNNPTSNDTITLTKDNASSTYTCAGTGNFSGSC